jgi:hypothetical protein
MRRSIASRPLSPCGSLADSCHYLIGRNAAIRIGVTFVDALNHFVPKPLLESQIAIKEHAYCLFDEFAN